MILERPKPAYTCVQVHTFVGVTLYIVNALRATLPFCLDSGPRLPYCARHMSDRRRFLMVAAALLVLLLPSCGRPNANWAVDYLFLNAYRPTWDGGATKAPSGYRILAGDVHCHIWPPDSPLHVTRGLAETMALAEEEHLDFVVLTPHIGARFFVDETTRQNVLHALSKLEQDVMPYREKGTLFFVGFEYTDHSYGHLGAAFGPLQKVLDEVSGASARKNPSAFFEAYVAHGGMLFLNHPLVTPLDSFIAIARADLSWRPLTKKGPFPQEIAAADRLAYGFEAFNLTATDMRDGWLLGDSKVTLQRTLLRIDQEIIARQKRLIPVGGSDSHGGYLRATMFVLAKTKSAEAVQEALRSGRVCVRDPAACTFEARTRNGSWEPVGSSFQHVDHLEVRAGSNDVDVLVNGNIARSGVAGHPMMIRLNPSHCSVVRARVGEGYSAPMYANCGF